jgi:hypothetical protein
MHFDVSILTVYLHKLTLPTAFLDQLSMSLLINFRLTELSGSSSARHHSFYYNVCAALPVLQHVFTVQCLIRHTDSSTYTFTFRLTAKAFVSENLLFIYMTAVYFMPAGLESI